MTPAVQLQDAVLKALGAARDNGHHMAKLEASHCLLWAECQRCNGEVLVRKSDQRASGFALTDRCPGRPSPSSGTSRMPEAFQAPQQVTEAAR